ncbi:MAG TPA: hypothetical protein VGF23_20505 [Gaiellaceae bacterium]|jgi:hypothetical protein
MFPTQSSRPVERRGRIAVAVLAAALAAGCTVGASAATPAGRSVTLRFIEKDAASSFIDNPPRQGPNAPPSIGDQIALRSELLTPARKHAGWLEASCTVTMGGPRGGGPCHGVFSFTRGQLMAITLLRFANDTTHVAIVGGTGIYRGATGTVDSVARSEHEFVDTLRLVLPSGA